MKTKLFYTVFASLSLFTSCSKDDATTPSSPDGNGDGDGHRTVKTSITEYDGIGPALENESIVTDMQACIFEGGKMTRIYNNLVLSGNSFDIQLDKYAGTLYVLANTQEQIHLEELKSQEITEEEWLKRCMTVKNNAPVHFYSGSVNLNHMEASQTTLPVSLKRGFARFDLQIRTAGTASVSRITLKNAAQSGTLFSDGSAYTPQEVPVGDMSVSFDTPLATDTPAVFYAYEQAHENLEISVEAVINGKSHTLTKAFNGDIMRNTIYTITVRQDIIDVTVEVSFDEWEEGPDTELVPHTLSSSN